MKTEKRASRKLAPVKTTPPGREEVSVTSISDAGPRHTDKVTVYDLRDPEALAQASTDRDAWGRQWTEIHILDNDHVAIEFKPRGTLEAAS